MELLHVVDMVLTQFRLLCVRSQLKVSWWHLKHSSVEFGVFIFLFPDDDVWGFFNWLADTKGSLSVSVYAEPISSSNSCGSNKVFCTLRNQIFSLGIYRKLNSLK